MAEINIAEIRPSGTIEGKVDALYDAFFMMRKQMMYYLSGVLDSENIHSITTDQLIAGTAKIGTAFIEDLEVGRNVTMGPDATISWGKVTGTEEIAVRDDIRWDNLPDIPTNLLTQPELIVALTDYVTTGNMTDALADTINLGNFSTIITKDYIASMNLVVGDEILMGANARISWEKVDNQPTIPTTPGDVGAMPAGTYIPSTTDITTIAADYVATPNLITNIAQVNDSLTLGSSSERGTLLFETGVGISSYSDVIGFGLLYSANTHLFDWSSHVDFTRCTDVDFTGVDVIGLDGSGGVYKFG